MKRRLLLIMGIMVILFCALYRSFIVVTLLYSVSSAITYPFFMVQKNVVQKIIQWNHDRLSIEKAHSLTRHLRMQNKQLLADNIALRGQLTLMNNLDDLLDFKKQYDTVHAILAQVVVRTIDQYEHSFLIDRGSEHGIEKDMIAVWYNCLIGRVTQIFPRHSKVTLITDSRCKIAAQTEASQMHGVIEGIHNKEFVAFSYVDHLMDINNNEIVVSSGQGLIFPKGFFLGRIASYQKEKLYYSIMVKIPFDLEEIDYCYVMHKR